MLIGYRRSSTVEQQAGFEEQEKLLLATGCTRILGEQVSSLAQRDELQSALAWVREGDTLVVTRLDRLARSTMDLLSIIATLEAKGVGFGEAAPMLDGRADAVQPRPLVGGAGGGERRAADLLGIEAVGAVLRRVPANRQRPRQSLRLEAVAEAGEVGQLCLDVSHSRSLFPLPVPLRGEG